MKSVFVIDCQPFAVIVEIHTTVTETDIPHAQVLTQLGKQGALAFKHNYMIRMVKDNWIHLWRLPAFTNSSTCLQLRMVTATRPQTLIFVHQLLLTTSTTRICRLRMGSCFQMRYCLPHLVIATPSLTCMQIARKHSSITLLHQCWRWEEPKFLLAMRDKCTQTVGLWMLNTKGKTELSNWTRCPYKVMCWYLRHWMLTWEFRWSEL